MKEVFLAVSQKIETQVSAVRWVDFDLGQLDQQELPPISFPAVLVGFSEAPFMNLGSGGQTAEMAITLRVAFKTFERTHSKTQASFRDVGLAHLDTLQAIHNAISGLSGTNFSDLTRANWANEKRPDLRVYQLTYICQYYDIPESPFVPVGEIPGAPDIIFCKDITLE